jgi:hypothetical protein
MSHFLVGVILPKNTINIKGAVETLLAPFDENIEVDAYDEECYCVGLKATTEAREAANAAVGTIDTFRENFHKMLKEEREAEEIRKALNGKTKVADARKLDTDDVDDDVDNVDARWQEFIKPWATACDKALTEHPLKDKANPDCSECKGTGTHPTTYNSESKWDWYSLGGRWDGAIQGEERPSKDGGFNFGDEHHHIEHNITKASDLIERPSDYPFALVLPDGTWVERGKMGWWGMVKDEQKKSTWREQIKTILTKYADCLVVGVDCHI